MRSVFCLFVRWYRLRERCLAGFPNRRKKSQSDKWRLLDFQMLVESCDFGGKKWIQIKVVRSSSCEVLETAIFSVNMRTAHISAYFFILFLF